MTAINREVAAKVLSVVDAGLVQGIGKPMPGKMCVEAAVCYALGEPHGDRPTCVGEAVRGFKILLNDAAWSSNAARAKGMREIAIAQLGSNTLDQREFATRIAIATVRHIISRLCRGRRLPELADRCAAVTTRAEAEAVAREASKTLPAAFAAAAYTAAYAASAADYDASAASASAAAYAASAAAYAANTAFAANAAYAASAYAVAYAEHDRVLAFAARVGTQVLMDMGSPGCEWLDLTTASLSGGDR
jgi:hypothetical protein